MSSCTTTTGVVVVVDFTAFHNGNPYDGTVARGCAASATTGYAALVAAGFTPSGDQHDGPAFVCRIDDDPSPAQEPCVDTPPPSASWSYWHGDLRTNSWTYSTTGATAYCPPPGSVDAWVFAGSPDAGSGGRPPEPPSAYAATAIGPPAPDPCGGPPAAEGSGAPPSPAAGGGPTPTGTAPAAGASGGSTSGPGTEAASPPSSSGPAVSRAGSGSGTGATAGGVGGSAGTGGPASTGPTGAPGGASARRGAGSGGGSRVVEASPTAAVGRAGAGSPLPVAVGLAVVAAMVAAGVLAARRRRRPDAGEA